MQLSKCQSWSFKPDTLCDLKKGRFARGLLLKRQVFESNNINMRRSLLGKGGEEIQVEKGESGQRDPWLVIWMGKGKVGAK